jgi:hypothetical protein
MLDYDLELLFTVKSKWRVRKLYLTHSSAIFWKGEWKASLWGKSCVKDAELTFGDTLLWQFYKVSSCIYMVGSSSSLRARKKTQSEMLLSIMSVCYSSGITNPSTDYFLHQPSLVTHLSLWVSGDSGLQPVAHLLCACGKQLIAACGREWKWPPACIMVLGSTSNGAAL